MEKLWANGERAHESPASGLGTPPTHNQVEFPSDGESPPHPSPRPRASTLAQSANGLDSAAPLPALSSNRQFLRAASQPTNVLGGSPTPRAEPPLTASKLGTGVKRPLVPLSNKILPTRSTLPEVTPVNSRKPLLSASAAKIFPRTGNGRISPPRRVPVQQQLQEDVETEDEAPRHPIAPRTSERNNLLRPRKEATPELKGRTLASVGRTQSSPDGMLGSNRRLSPPDVSPIAESYTPDYTPGNDSPQPQNPVGSSAIAGASTSSLSTTASSTHGRGSVKARLLDWKSSIGSWSKSARSRPPIPGRPSLESIHRALGGGGTDSARPSIDSAAGRGSFERPSLDTVRVPGGGGPSSAGPPLDTIRAGDSGRDESEDERGRQAYAQEPGESEDPGHEPVPRSYSGRGYEGRSASAAGWNDPRERETRPGTSSGYYAQPVQAQVRAVQQAHVRRMSDTLRPGEPAPRSPNTGTVVASASMKHRRSPTAPSPRTTASSLSNKEKENQRVSGYEEDAREREREMEREREAERERMERERAEREVVRSGSMQGLAAKESSQKRDRFICNKQEYTVIDCIGRGGSSKVYKVISPANKVYALKRVRLDSKVDEETMRGYVNEMQLLKRLDGNERIIKLIDSQAHGKGNRYLMMVMELGEIDLAKLLQERQGQLLQPHWIAIYWQQMLEAVQTIHEEKIVHSDLKPANFVLVKGSLKLIDFGIAKAIANDTTNIQREHQVGTLNYMSPESIEETQTANGRRLKLGRPSDVWSLGCILYQMIYGRPPFYAIPGPVPKLRAISDPNHVIDYPAQSIPTVPSSEKDGAPKQIPEWATPVPPDVIETLKGCLTRDPKQRKTIPDLLDDPWLRSWRHTSGNSEPPPKLKDTEAIVNEAWLKQIIEHASREAMENGALDEEAVAQMAQNLLPALRLANTKHPAYRAFC
ncbi:Serine/threonine-protein kinase [Ceratobasidium sp. AG-Ba]|nr:Serine/threonine-protein kinase [Ceratobasidium sp. AG-Ba]QRW06933.1 Serine/threonine-protein kinase [Ceratobasidium sp. AG-Ba]